MCYIYIQLKIEIEKQSSKNKNSKSYLKCLMFIYDLIYFSFCNYQNQKWALNAAKNQYYLNIYEK